nr:hypothetical protein [Providencia rettgeri]
MILSPPQSVIYDLEIDWFTPLKMPLSSVILYHNCSLLKVNLSAFFPLLPTKPLSDQIPVLIQGHQGSDLTVFVLSWAVSGSNFRRWHKIGMINLSIGLPYAQKIVQKIENRK